MKVRDLLEKIKYDIKVPEKIEVCGLEWDYCEDSLGKYYQRFYENGWEELTEYDVLDCDVEIIENNLKEEKKMKNKEQMISTSIEDEEYTKFKTILAKIKRTQKEVFNEMVKEFNSKYEVEITKKI